ncbi:hypothetical protein [Spiroplasma taiwanense]|uniref:Uncharacterized protein n=1 Tax=Spiroplasma taiwanense CT-1 TaxID=1276220 RepID=S5LTP5_9MOLU|nr:hypothetical protein [Spiroplasma taiwanense]AGR41084.1 hypothetical protein STAIW_v1c04380 [Spiroplasma taiwanense CT-1]
MHRTISTNLKAVLNYNVETVFNKFLQLAAKDINRNLTNDDLIEDAYFYSKRGGKQILLLSELTKNESITIEWFANDHKFTRKVEFRKKGIEKTKIKFFDSAKGMEAVWGFMSNYRKATYQLEVKKTFNIQILQIRINLEEDENKKQKFIGRVKFLGGKKNK